MSFGSLGILETYNLKIIYKPLGFWNFNNWFEQNWPTDCHHKTKVLSVYQVYKVSSLKWLFEIR